MGWRHIEIRTKDNKVLDLNTWFFDIYFDDCLSLARIVNKFCFLWDNRQLSFFLCWTESLSRKFPFLSFLVLRSCCTQAPDREVCISFIHYNISNIWTKTNLKNKKIFTRRHVDCNMISTSWKDRKNSKHSLQPNPSFKRSRCKLLQM